METLIRKLKAVKWCVPKGCWYLPLNKEQYHLLALAIKDKAILQTKALKTYLEQRKVITTAKE